MELAAEMKISRIFGLLQQAVEASAAEGLERDPLDEMQIIDR